MSRIHTNPQHNKEREIKNEKKKKMGEQKHMFSLKDSPTAWFCEVMGQKKKQEQKP